MPVYFLRSGNVSGVVKQHVFVALDDPDAGVVEVFGEPAGADQNFRMYVSLAGDVGIDGRYVGGGRSCHSKVWEKVPIQDNRNEKEVVQ